MPDIKITFEEVRGKAQEIRAHNEVLTDTLVSIKGAINALESVWTSDASDTIRSKITGMQPKFDLFRDTVESYAKFLDNAAANYESTENAVNTTAASQFN